MDVITASMVGSVAGSAGELSPRERLVTGRYLFGHQSVGGNVLEGVAAIQADREAGNAVAGLRVVALSGGAIPEDPGLYHVAIGRNGAPQSKLDEFAALVEQAPEATVALMKFCYVDVTGRTDAAALFGSYRAMVDELRARRPDVRLVHVTMPLTVDRGTLFYLRTIVRGKTSHRELNWIRAGYNHLLRDAYRGEPIFDLAALESTNAAGHVVSARYRGVAVPSLAAEWTYDGGHLNDAGRRRIAAAFLATLASVR